jgi:hypothetical protein
MTTTSRTVAHRAPGQARRGFHPGIALAVIAGAQLMVVLDATIINIALPHPCRQAVGACPRTPAARWIAIPKRHRDSHLEESCTR